MQRPAYGMLGHLTLRFGDQHMVTYDDTDENVKILSAFSCP